MEPNKQRADIGLRRFMLSPSAAAGEKNKVNNPTFANCGKYGPPGDCGNMGHPARTCPNTSRSCPNAPNADFLRLNSDGCCNAAATAIDVVVHEGFGFGFDHDAS